MFCADPLPRVNLAIPLPLFLFPVSPLLIPSHNLWPVLFRGSAYHIGPCWP